MFDFVAEEKVIDLAAGEEFDVEVFGFVEVPLAVGLDTYGEEAVGEVGCGAGVARSAHKVGPYASCVAGFLFQFASGGLFGRFPFLHHAGGNLVACAVYPVAVLQLHHEFAVFRYGYHVDPVGIFKHIEFRVYASVGEAHLVMAHAEPWRTRHYDFAFKSGPPVFVVVRNGDGAFVFHFA